MSNLATRNMDFSGRERNRWFVRGQAGTFVERGYLDGVDLSLDGRVAVTADLDRDGAEDLLVASRNAPRLSVFMGAKKHPSVGLVLAGDGRTVPRDPVGATATVSACGKKSIHGVGLVEGFGAQSSRSLSIGVGDCGEVALDIAWPGGERQQVDGLEPGGIYRIEMGKSAQKLKPTSRPAQAPSLTWLRDQLPGQGPTYVALTASWCQACKRATPRWEALAKALEGRVALAFVSTEPGDDKSVLSTLYPGANVLGLSKADQAALVEKLRDHLGGDMPPLPSGILLAADGTVLWQPVGVPRASEVLARAETGRGAEGSARAGGPLSGSAVGSLRTGGTPNGSAVGSLRTGGPPNGSAQGSLRTGDTISSCPPLGWLFLTAIAGLIIGVLAGRKFRR